MIRIILMIFLGLSLVTGCGKKPENAASSSKSPAGKTESKSSDSRQAGEKKEIEKPAKSGEEGKYEKPVFKLKNWEKDVKKPEVEDDASNITVEKIDADEKDESDKEINAPAESLASKLVNKSEKILWNPKWYFEGVGGVKLPSICTSPDLSVMAIIETTGTDKGPNGSRIVLINTYNWQILRIHEFQENKFKNICFLPDGKRLALWSEKQSLLKKPYELIIVGIEKGEIQSTSKDIKTDVSDIIAVQGGIMAKSSEERTIFCFDPSNISKSSKVIKSSNLQGVFAVSPENDRVVLAGENSIEMFDSAGLEQIKQISLNENYVPDNAVFAGKSDWIAVSSYNKPGFLFKDGSKKQFCDIMGHSLAFNAEEKLLVFEKYLNNEICVVDVPDFNEIAKFTPSSINPKTKGTAIYAVYLKHLNKYAVVDSYGNLCLYSKYLKSKKWRKQLVLSSKN
ncbi:MAG TPA: hypothetical protein DET40_17800 [Lentisphaeria bacterium]|nr:MAG: hypothetical protein A2X45_02210 [Lentisphaerae bacterium GWF2_50_93]HCE45397.1 hypothetical protein [Lentisphaeria bacterium]